MNARITERLEALANQLEAGEVTLQDFAEQIRGHTTALENLKYSQIKEAQLAVAQLESAAASGQLVDARAVGDWLRRWLASVPH